MMFVTHVTRISILILCLLSPFAGAETIELTASESSELNGDGYAFLIPNLDGIGTDAEGNLIYNPLGYPPLPFDPARP
ncbi:MAG: hypothetical protein AAF514_01825, partial [Verrucomicrobiota bacterium]